MKKYAIFLMILGLTAQFATAQTNRTDERKTILEELEQIKKDQKNPVNALLNSTNASDTGRGERFLGTAETGVVYVYHSCDPTVLLDELGVRLGEDDRCLVNTPNGPTARATFDNIGRFSMPGGAIDNLLHYVLNNTVQTELQNDSNFGQSVFISFVPRLTIESAALNDPSAVDPITRRPLNGVLTVNVFGPKQVSRTVPANDFEFYIDNYSSSATRGFSRGYFADLGLPQRVIDNLYLFPMTVKLGMRVSARNVALGQFYYSTRFTGN